MEKSIVLPALYPDSMNSYTEFSRALNLINTDKINWLEFYYKNSNKKEIKNIIEEHGFETIYLGAMALKSNKLHLSSLNENNRSEALKVAKQCVYDAYFFNSRSLLINSGKRPDKKKYIKKEFKTLYNSIIELLEYSICCASKFSSDYLLNIKLEPGDIDKEAFAIIGPTDLAIEMTQNIRRKYNNFSLTLDTSHLKQLNEDPMLSIKKGFKYCEHIHLANCVLKNKDSSFYGDKHPNFDVEDGEFSFQQIEKLYEEIINLYREHNIVIGLEIINRGINKKDNFKRILQSKQFNWFF